MDGVILTPLKQIFNPKGDILHAMKKSDIGYDGFGEAYFSAINHDEKKGWKKHTKMTLNLIVPIGEIEFVIFNDKRNKFFNIKLSSENYQRLTIKPNLWVAFKGIGTLQNILLNIASIEHDSTEALTKDLDEIVYEW